MNDIATASTAAVPGLGLMMLKSIGMLCIVLAFLALLLYIFRQLTERRTGRINKKYISHLSSFHIGPKERLMLIDAAGKKMLIGITQHTITRLAEYDKGEGIESVQEETTGDFRSILNRFSDKPSLPESEATKASEK